MIAKGTVHRGEIYWVDFDPSVGHEFKSRRPALVLQSDRRLQKLNLVTVVPFTSNLKNKVEGDMIVSRDNHNKLQSDSVLKMSCIMSLDYSRFIKRIGSVDEIIMEKVKESLKDHFDIV